jgi:hypothetical protein
MKTDSFKEARSAPFEETFMKWCWLLFTAALLFGAVVGTDAEEKPIRIALVYASEQQQHYAHNLGADVTLVLRQGGSAATLAGLGCGALRLEHVARASANRRGDPQRCECV